MNDLEKAAGMNLLQRVRQQYQTLSQPKAISHRPDLENRVHVYRQGAAQIVQAMDEFADYAAVYSSYAWVQKAISKVAENIAGLPVRVVDAQDKPVDGHPLTLLLANVNDEETPMDLWSAYVVHMLLGGEAFYEIVPDGRGRPVELWLRRPDRVAVVPDNTRLAYPTASGYIYESEEALVPTIGIDAPYMAHDKFYNPLNPWRGLAPINAVREGVTIDLFAQAWSKGFLRNNARPDFAIIAPQGITQSEKNRIEDQFIAKHRGADGAHLPTILEEGVTDIKTFSFPPKDLEWLEQRKFSRDEVGAVFGVPDEIMGYGKDTYENFQTALEVFWTLTLLPFMRRRDVTLTHHFTRYGLGLTAGQRIATDLSGVDVLQEDKAEKVELAQKFWAMGVPFNTLDATLELGIGPVPGGEVGYLAGMLKTVEQVANPPAPLPMLAPVGAPQDEPDMEPDEPDDEPDEEPEDMPDDMPQQRAVYLLPEGAKDAAKRALKKLIQQVQDKHLRQVRNGEPWAWAEIDRAELERWMGDGADDVFWSVWRKVAQIGGDHDTISAAYAALKADESLARLLEVEAAAPFFTHRVTLPDGPLTREIYKNLLLQLDPSDDEAEQSIRAEIERRMARDVGRAFDEQLGELLPADAGDDVIRAASSRVDATSGPVREALRRNLEQAANLGVTVGLDTLEQIGYGFDWTLASADAARWASQYSYELVRGINTTTTARLRVAVDDWFQERTTLPDLVRELQPTFGRRRAQLIAQTETTRAAHEGNVIGFEQSGVVDEVEWYSVRDERVCPICGDSPTGMHGKRLPLRGGTMYPPAHPGCRCFVRPVVRN